MSNAGSSPVDTPPKPKFKSQSVNSLFKKMAAPQPQSSVSPRPAKSLSVSPAPGSDWHSSGSSLGSATSTTPAKPTRLEKGIKTLSLSRKTPVSAANSTPTNAGSLSTPATPTNTNAWRRSASAAVTATTTAPAPTKPHLFDTPKTVATTDTLRPGSAPRSANVPDLFDSSNVLDLMYPAAGAGFSWADDKEDPEFGKKLWPDLTASSPFSGSWAVNGDSLGGSVVGSEAVTPQPSKDHSSSSLWHPVSSSASLAVSPVLWASTGTASLEETPTTHRMSRFFPSPLIEQRKDFPSGPNSAGKDLSSRPHSTGFASSSSPMSFGILNEMPSSLGIGPPAPLMPSSRNPSFVDPLFDGFTLGSLIDPTADLRQATKADPAPTNGNRQTLKKEEEFPAKLVVRTTDEGQLDINHHDETDPVSLPFASTKKNQISSQNSHAKLTKYIKTIITKQHRQFMIYVASLPYDTPISQCHALIGQAFRDYAEITSLVKDENAKSSKVQPENDLFIRFKIVVKLLNDQRLPFKSHRFINEATGRDSKMLLFFDCPCSSPTGGDVGTASSSSSSSAKRQEISNFPEGFSSTFHRRGVNNFMFVRELQSKMITNRARGPGAHETAEFRVSLPIEELNLGLSHESGADIGFGDGDDHPKRMKRSYVVNIDVRELENKPIAATGNKDGSSRKREHSTPVHGRSYVSQTYNRHASR